MSGDCSSLTFHDFQEFIIFNYQKLRNSKISKFQNFKISKFQRFKDSKIQRFLGFREHPPPCLQAPLECTDVEKLFLQGLLSCLKGCPPSNTRIAPRTLAYHFSTLFLMSKNQAHKLQNGSLGDPKITKKTRKMRSGMECGKA